MIGQGGDVIDGAGDCRRLAGKDLWGSVGGGQVHPGIFGRFSARQSQRLDLAECVFPGSRGQQRNLRRMHKPRLAVRNL